MEQNVSPNPNETQGLPVKSVQAGLCEIHIRGHLDERWAVRFEGWSIHLEADGNTRLSGSLKDQAALHGLLKKVRNFGLSLLSVSYDDPAQAKG